MKLARQVSHMAIAAAVVAGLTAVVIPASPVVAAAAGPLGVPAYSSFDTVDNGDPVQVRTLSGRADLVSGGDALVEVVVPAGHRRRARCASPPAAATSPTRSAPGGPGLRGLVTGLPLGASTITATLPDGSGARLVVHERAAGRPGLLRPADPAVDVHATARRAPDCTPGADGRLPLQVDATRRRSGLQAYDPANPPTDVATTTTDEGNEVPFIVREETGYSLRDQYKIAALWDPAQGARAEPDRRRTPASPTSSCSPTAPAATRRTSRAARPTCCSRTRSSQGFAVASHALDNAGHNCNIVTQAESLIMTKEMVVERFGPLRYTIGSGCSGGSLVQQQVANAYPGVYQGITPQCSFTDAWSSAQQYVDYVGLRDYLEDPATLPEHRITPAQWPSIFGHANPANQITFTDGHPQQRRAEPRLPRRARGGRLRREHQPRRRALHVPGLHAQRLRRRRATGKARRPISNVGIQYGLSGPARLPRRRRGRPDPAAADAGPVRRAQRQRRRLRHRLQPHRRSAPPPTRSRRSASTAAAPSTPARTSTRSRSSTSAVPSRAPSTTSTASTRCATG